MRSLPLLTCLDSVPGEDIRALQAQSLHCSRSHPGPRLVSGMHCPEHVWDVVMLGACWARRLLQNLAQEVVPKAGTSRQPQLSWAERRASGCRHRTDLMSPRRNALVSQHWGVLPQEDSTKCHILGTYKMQQKEPELLHSLRTFPSRWEGWRSLPGASCAIARRAGSCGRLHSAEFSHVPRENRQWTHPSIHSPRPAPLHGAAAVLQLFQVQHISGVSPCGD